MNNALMSHRLLSRIVVLQQVSYKNKRVKRNRDHIYSNYSTTFGMLNDLFYNSK